MDAAGTEPFQKAVARDDAFQSRIIPDEGHDDPTCHGRIGRTGSLPRSLSYQRLGLACGTVVHHKGVTRSEKIGSHRKTQSAEPDKTDCFAHASSSSCTVGYLKRDVNVMFGAKKI
jgi:hypothetical protein